MGFGLPQPRMLVRASDLYERGQKLKPRNAIIPADPMQGSVWQRDLRIATEPEMVEWAPGCTDLCVWIISEKVWYRWALLDEDPKPMAKAWPLEAVWVEV